MGNEDTFDDLISTWLQETAPARIPERVLDAAAERTRTTRQQVRWRGLLRGIDVSRSILVLGTTAAIAVAAVVALSPRVGPPEVGRLPTTPAAWSRVSIDSPWPIGGVDVLVAGPRGLLAFLGETGSGAMQLSVSTDGHTWTLVPNDQFPVPDAVLSPEVRPVPAVVTARGFLFVSDGNDVWASDDGYTWQRRADRARDADLRAGTIKAVAAGGPGIVAVGSANTAWYSEDGADWTLAEVPAPPIESFAAQGIAPTVDMQGVAASGNTMVAWGHVAVVNGDNRTILAPVLWTSDDGRSWAQVSDVTGIARLERVAAGPDGFVAIGGADTTGSDGIWFSADGRSWRAADVFQFDAGSNEEPIELSIAAASSGFVAAGAERICSREPCPDSMAVIWTSPDGRSWSRLPSDDLFVVAQQGDRNHAGAGATSVVTRDDRFVVAGTYDGSAVVWISRTSNASEAPIDNAPPPSAPASDARTPFLGVWTSTSDSDGGTQTMTVEPAADDSVVVVVTDTIATVCSGASSTMTGSGSVQGDSLVIPTSDYRCDDGTEPQPMGGPGLNDELRNLTYTYHAATDTLSVGIGDVWLRLDAEVPEPSGQVAPPSEPVAASALPSVDLGSPEPIAGEILCGNHNGKWSYPATTAQLNAEVLGCSIDGGRVLIQMGNENLFVLHADGTETQVTEELSGFNQLLGSSRPSGATISPDGSRVAFAGLTKRGLSCHHGALFAVDADGGAAEVLWESQAASDGGIVRYPTYSPDGAQIAFADGYCDSNHSVWVMNADGSNAHQIVTSDIGPLGATHVHGLAWSAAGDQVALAVDDGTWTFASDGSGVTQSAATEFCWPGREC